MPKSVEVTVDAVASGLDTVAVVLLPTDPQLSLPLEMAAVSCALKKKLSCRLSGPSKFDPAEANPKPLGTVRPCVTRRECPCAAEAAQQRVFSL